MSDTINVTFDYGVPGAQGADGSQGAQGATGSDGSQGAQGAQGANGSAGTQGSQGAQGASGSTGAQGAQGAQGASGAAGSQGTQGVQGAQGAQGVQGAQGTQGSQGNQGTQGTQGNQGNQGTQGSSAAPIFIPAAAMTPATTNGATPSAAEMSTNKEMVDYLSFDSATSQAAWFPVRFPAGWNAGTVTFQYLWKQTSTGSGGVTWGAAGVSVADNETLDVALGTEVTTDDTALTSATKLHITSVGSAVTIAGSPAVGEAVWFRVQRKTADANDTLAESALLIGVVVTYS